MESPPHSPVVELDTSAASVVLPLAPQTATPFSTSPQRSEIYVRRLAWSESARRVVVVEKGVSPEGAIVESRRYLDLLQDFVLPIYALPRLNRTKWSVEVGYSQGADPVDYPFRSREAAFQFQQLLTGYRPVDVFDDVTCVVTYWKTFRLPLPQYSGSGQIQLWVEAEPETGPHPNSLSPTSSRRSSQSSQSTTRRPMSIASIQTTSTLVQRHAERSVMVIQDPRPPLVVAFLKDRDGDDGYTMLQMKATDLQLTEATSHREEALLSVSSALTRHFGVDKYLPAPGAIRLSAWNLCERRDSASVPSSRRKPLECSHLALNLGSSRDPANLEKRQTLHDAMLRVQLGHLDRLQRLNAFRNQQVVQSSREMLMRTPPASARTSMISTRSLPPVVIGSPRGLRNGGFGHGGGSSDSEAGRPVLPEIQTQPWMSTSFITAHDDLVSPELDGAGVTPELGNFPSRRFR